MAESMVALTLVDHSLRSGVIPPVRLEERQAEVIEDRWRRYMEECRPTAESQS